MAYAVPNYKAHASALPNDPGLRKQWNFIGPFGIGMDEAWTLATAQGAPGGRGTVVAVLDSGVAYERHGRYRRAPDLRRSTFLKGYDFVGHDRHPNDVFGHGTHVAGTIAQATNNGIGAAGIAYRARIMPLRVLDWRGSGDSVAIARAIRYAAKHGADVINLSLEFPTEVRGAEIPDVIGALRYAQRKGVTVVAAAGNQADGAVVYPARAGSVIAVGAVTASGCEAEYSNAGTDLDVVAPGGGIDAPDDDDPWDAAHCRPDEPGRSIYQETFIRGVKRFGLPGGYGHLDGEPAREWHRGPSDRHQEAGRTPEPGADQGPHRAHLHRPRRARVRRPLRLRTGERSERAALRRRPPADDPPRSF